MLRAQHLLRLRRLVFIDDIALEVYNPQDGDRWDFSAAVRDHRIGGGQFQ
jgi:hypothetical protein